MEESPSRKRSLESLGDEPTSKRRRKIPDPIVPLDKFDTQGPCSSIVTPDELAKKGLRRSIGLALKKVGFHSADAQAMEMFTQMAETCKFPPHFHRDPYRLPFGSSSWALTASTQTCPRYSNKSTTWLLLLDGRMRIHRILNAF